MTLANVVPGGAFIVAIAIVFFYVVPTYSGKITETKAALARQDAALEAAREFVAKKDSLASQKNAIPPEHLAQLEQLLPRSVNSIAVILDLASLAGRVGVRIQKIDASKPAIGTPEATADSSIGSLDINLSVNGTYAAFRAFLDAVERSAQILDVTDFSAQSSATGVYTFNLKLRLYWLR